MSSFYELRWREDQLQRYSTDKLNYIFNSINFPLTVRYKQDYDDEVSWRRAVAHHQQLIGKVKGILQQRPDAHSVRQIWLKQHHLQKAKAKNGKTSAQLAFEFPAMASQLGAFMELENIEEKYFDQDFKPRYDEHDFQDLLPQNFARSGFTKEGVTKKKLLALYPQVKAEQWDQLLKKVGYQGSLELIPYWYAVNAKRVLVDSDAITDTFSY